MNPLPMLVIIPAWNEEAVIGPVLAEITSAVRGLADVLVVSDGSTDATASIAREAGVVVLDLPLNLGVGGAMRAGYLYAARNGYEYAVQTDADGQHNPAEIHAVRGPRQWAMNVLSLVLSRVCGTRLTDTTSGFKLTNRRAIHLFSQEYPAEYLGDTIEALVIAVRHGLAVRQLPVQMRQRAGGTPSHGFLKSARLLARAFLALGIALTRPRSSVRNREGGGE